MYKKGRESNNESRVLRMMVVKIHKAEKRKMVSICDKDILGKKFEEGDLQLEVSKVFYNGQDLSEEETLQVIRDADSLNIVGDSSIKFALKNKLIDKQNIIRIKKIPHVIAVLR